jgi:tetratricopeptide (TPR) repeat protein
VRALALVLGDSGAFAAAEAYVDSDDRHVAMFALQWTSHARENVGDLDGAMAASRRALDLWRPEDGPWARAQHHTQLAGLHAQQGRLDLAEQHAAEGLGVLDALKAWDDAVQLRGVLAYAAIARGDLTRAQEVVAEIAAEPEHGLWGAGFVAASTRAELALALRDTAAGLAGYDEAVAAADRIVLPGLTQDPGLTPWTLYAESSALAAYARHGTGDQGLDLVERLRAKAPALTEPGRTRADYPVVGCVLFALGAWALLRDERVEPALGLLALAERFGYSRYTPSTAWEPMAAAADAVAPGALAARVASYGDRRGPDLLEEARAAVLAV